MASLAGALFDPACSQVGGGLIRFFENNLPLVATVRCLGDAVEQVLFALADLQAAEAGIGDVRMAITGGNGFKLACGLSERGCNRFEVLAGIIGEIDLSILAGCIDPYRVS